MQFSMKKTPLLLILLAVLSLGCTKNKVADSEDVDFTHESKEIEVPVKGDEKNKLPAQQKLASVLCDLAGALQPEQFAQKHGISFLNDKVRVYIYFAPKASNPERKKMLDTHDIQVEKASKDLARAWVPVNRLIPLSEETIIRYVGLPKTLIKAKERKDE